MHVLYDNNRCGSEIQTKQRSLLCGENVEKINIKPGSS